MWACVAVFASIVVLLDSICWRRGGLRCMRLWAGGIVLIMLIEWLIVLVIEVSLLLVFYCDLVVM